MQELMAQTEREVINFGASWREAGTARKREIQSALFPDGLAWDSNLFFFCPRNPTLIQFLTDTLEMMHVVGVPDGI